MDQKLDAMLSHAGKVAQSDQEKGIQLFLQATEEAFAGDYNDEDRSMTLLMLGLTEWNSGEEEQAYKTLARLMAFCARTGQLSTFRVLQNYASLEVLSQILINYCPVNETVDDTLCLLSGLREIVDFQS
jgi:hypothetical protein